MQTYDVTHVLLHYTVDGRQILPAIEAMGLSLVARTDSYSLYSTKHAKSIGNDATTH